MEKLENEVSFYFSKMLSSTKKVQKKEGFSSCHLTFFFIRCSPKSIGGLIGYVVMFKESEFILFTGVC